MKTDQLSIGRLLRFAVIALAAITASLACARSIKFQSTSIEVPNFTLQDGSGRHVSLSDYRGHPVLLVFWSPWCSECALDMPVFETISRRLGPEGLSVIGVAVESSERSVREFRNRHQIRFPTFIDRDNRVRTAFGISELPLIVIVDAMGHYAELQHSESGMTNPTRGGFDWQNEAVINDLKALL